MLKDLLAEFNLSEDKIDKLNRLREIVLEYNEHTNLTSIKDEEEFNVKHILDSLSILKYFKLEGKSILDVGSGGGFPGLALAIVLEDSIITMLDSNNKKTQFIDYAIKELALTNANTINARVEETNIEEKFDIVVSRAVASLNILLEITAFASKVGGQLIYYKGANAGLELTDEWDKVKQLLGVELNQDIKFSLNEENERRLIEFVKVSKTHKDFPRIYSQIKKDPIYK